MDPIAVYLDQNHWVRLTRGRCGLDEPAKQIFDGLQELVNDGTFSFFLSAANYLEAWHRRTYQSRLDLAETMKALTQWKTIAPILTITRLEISRALFAGEDIDWASIFGVGVNHAFGSENGRLRPMTKAWTVTHGEGEEIPGVLDGVRSLQEDHPDAWELFNLAGLPGSDEPLGDEAANAPQSFERRPQHRLGSDYARDGQALRETLDDRGELSKLRDALVIEDMHAVGDELAEVLALLRSAPYFFREPGHGNAFHSCLSTRRALVDLRYLQLQDRNMPLEQHDVTDLVSLATAFVYADVVVTEKRWAHFARRLKIEEMHGTRVVSRIEDVAAMRASWGAAWACRGSDVTTVWPRRRFGRKRQIPGTSNLLRYRGFSLYAPRDLNPEPAD